MIDLGQWQSIMTKSPSKIVKMIAMRLALIVLAKSVTVCTTEPVR